MNKLTTNSKTNGNNMYIVKTILKLRFTKHHIQNGSDWRDYINFFWCSLNSEESCWRNTHCTAIAVRTIAVKLPRCWTVRLLTVFVCQIRKYGYNICAVASERIFCEFFHESTSAQNNCRSKHNAHRQPTIFETISALSLCVFLRFLTLIF